MQKVEIKNRTQILATVTEDEHQKIARSEVLSAHRYK